MKYFIDWILIELDEITFIGNGVTDQALLTGIWGTEFILPSYNKVIEYLLQVRHWDKKLKHQR